MFHKRRSQVLVAGAGPVGLSAALFLHHQGLEVAVVDAAWRSPARSYALTLHPRTLELLDAVGLAEPLVSVGHRVETAAWYSGEERRAEVHFGQLPGPFPFLLVLPQDRLEDLLRQRLTEAGVKVHWNHRVAGLESDGDSCSVELEWLDKESTGYGVAVTEWVVEKAWEQQARFVVGADGHHSMVRRQLGLGFEAVAPARVFGVFEVRAPGAEVEEVRVILDGDGPTTSVLWPLGRDHLRWSFQLTDGEPFAEPRTKRRLAVQVGGGAYPHLPPERLTELAAERAPWFTTPVERIDWSVAVRFETRLAEAFGRGSAWLVGDAAHLAGPVAVRSMNGGIEEAAQLAENMAAVAAGGAPVESLDSWGGTRRDQWQRLLRPGVGFAAGDGCDPWVRDHLEAITATLPATGRDLELLGGQLGLEAEG